MVSHRIPGSLRRVIKENSKKEEKDRTTQSMSPLENVSSEMGNDHHIGHESHHVILNIATRKTWKLSFKMKYECSQLMLAKGFRNSLNSFLKKKKKHTE